jgi:hypothetical protein
VRAYIYDIYDGDTVYYHAKLGYYQWSAFQIGRLLGVQAPELRPLRSREAATQSRDFLWENIQKYALNRNVDRSKLASWAGHNMLWAQRRI